MLMLILLCLPVPRHSTGLPDFAQEAKYFVIGICLLKLHEIIKTKIKILLLELLEGIK